MGPPLAARRCQKQRPLPPPIRLRWCQHRAAAHEKKAGKRKREAAEAVERVDPIDQPTADAWLKNYNYMQSDNGFPASVKLTVRLVELLGASYRIIQPTDAGATPYVDFALCHFALVCPIIGGVFEKIAGLKAKRRCGLARGHLPGV